MNQKIIIEGGRKLKGEVTISGAKNAALKLMAAALILDDTCEIYNVPELTDVSTMAKLLQTLGAKVDYDKNEKKITINSENIDNVEAHYDFVSKMRASFIVLGSLLGRFHEAKVALPGGCSIGERRIDLHIKGLESLGAQIKIEGGYVIAKAKKLTGAKIYLDRPSVGATENILLAAVLAEGSTVLSNAAQEPEIIDLANFLNAMGADISGAGTSEIIINGVRQKDLKPLSYTTIPDRIEAGTYISAIMATRGKAIIRNIFPNHLSAVISKVIEMGGKISVLDPFSIEVACNGKPNAVNIVTQPYPGFPTDLQSPFISALAVAEGVSIVTENLYENRFRQMGELTRMGADVQQESNKAIIKGVRSLTGAQLIAPDLRAGVALIIAGLCADGVSEITDIHHVDRGYEKIIEKFSALGANIKRVDSEDNNIDAMINNMDETIF
ncbi:MAG TPA: UDP-N-acetylglucosamine 1-carboxyvinyltransferase [Candidatus Gastranaerophilales bacterium]|nr:UDP-N-acetylglucosamine 1-carboxyvinyltransferase [Candidatus Gastranaerophilales bacterium]